MATKTTKASNKAAPARKAGSVPKGPWNRGRAVGAKKPLTEDHLQVLRLRLRQDGALRDLALLEVSISTMLRGSDVRRLLVSDVRSPDGEIAETVTVRQQKTSKPITVSLSPKARDALAQLIDAEGKMGSSYLFTALRKPDGEPLTTRALRQSVKRWAGLVGLDPSAFSTHSLRRTQATTLYRKTGNLRAVQLLLGHANISATQRYLGIEAEDALKLLRRYQL